MDTMSLIKNSFFKLLDEMPYEKITVLMICKEASISSKTFKRYFAEISNIVDERIRDDFVKPVTQLREILPVEEIKSAPLLMIENAFRIFYENRDSYKKLLHYRGNMTLVETITQEVRALNQEIYSTYDISQEERDFAAYFFASTQAMIFMWWVQEKEDVLPKQMAKQYYAWAFGHWQDLMVQKYE